jgi:molybdopterin synthase catalytic subunit
MRSPEEPVDDHVEAPGVGDDWLALTYRPLPVGAVADWVVRPSCGALALFCGTARDHAEGRDDVLELEYEAYEEQVVPRLAAVAAEMRARWPMTGRVALLHRTGPLAIGETAVIVAVSTPHRPEAFAAARFGIDAIKASVPIWKKERWGDGEAWGLEGQHLQPASEVVG